MCKMDFRMELVCVVIGPLIAFIGRDGPTENLIKKFSSVRNTKLGVSAFLKTLHLL